MDKYQTNILNSDIGERIRKRRLQMGLTGNSLGKQLGLSQQQISRYERGTQNFTIRQLCLFANILQCDLNYFLE
ncbi:helix-turn-helix domain-containing protein [Providencia rettgeri]|uniref:Helix-turn-helix domain-containing protein n=1 Tax=Providencia rettgeri TaxID=587 RepID=A0AAE2ZG13_PRORE|nr:helix-turn-helix transcriptional regulator [Providencia rettgeri]MBW3119002.1 helix-turn-helix domain-containing protein [Providencia rettgeri]